ncbi:MAG: pseudouridine synthase family protein [Thalassotalea sp.]
MSVIELHIKIEAHHLEQKISITHLLAEQSQLSIASVKQAIQKGALWFERYTGTAIKKNVNPYAESPSDSNSESTSDKNFDESADISNGNFSYQSRGKNKAKRLRRLKTALRLGDQLHFYYNSEVLSQAVADAKLMADFQDYSIWYKPYGMLSQGSKWSDHCTVERFVNDYFQQQRSCFIVHRLDRAATGLIVVGHSKKATQALTKLFEQHNLTKSYQIIVAGDFSAQPQPLVIETKVENKPAKSTFSHFSFDSDKNVSVVNVLIETGRKHQIRIHAASIGFPVIGDRLYGQGEQSNKQNLEQNIDQNIDQNIEQSNDLKLEQVIDTNIHADINTLNDLQLCAMNLAFICPLSAQAIDVNLPENLQLSLVSLK